MRLVMSVGDEPDEEELRSLHEWLTADRSIRRRALPQLASRSAPAAGQQSAVVDIVSLVLSSGFSAASLGVSLANWRATSPQRPTVTVERPDGTKVTISGTDPEQAQRLLRRLIDPES